MVILEVYYTDNVAFPHCNKWGVQNIINFFSVRLIPNKVATNF